MLLIVIVYTWRLRRRWSQFQADEKEDSVAAWYSSLLAGQSAEHFAARNRSAHSTEVTRWTSCCFDALVLLCFVQISLQLAKFLHYGSSLPRWLVKLLNVHPCGVNIFKTLRLRDRWTEFDETWYKTSRKRNFEFRPLRRAGRPWT